MTGDTGPYDYWQAFEREKNRQKKVTYLARDVHRRYYCCYDDETENEARYDDAREDIGVG